MTVLFKPILALHITNFPNCQNYWGEQIDMFAPQYFHGGRGCPPPQNRRLWGGGGACQLKFVVPPYENPRPPSAPLLKKILASPLFRSAR